MMRPAARRFVLEFATAMLMLGPGVVPAHADPTFYNTPADYDAATTGNTTINFEGIAPTDNFLFLPTPPGITLSGVNFTVDQTNSNSAFFAIGDGYYYSTAVLSSQQSATGADNILITLPGPFTAFAADFGNFAQTPVTFTLSNGVTFTEPTPAYPGLAFIGLASSTPFTTIAISEPLGDALNLADFTFGNAAVAIPEPGSLTSGLIAATVGLGWGCRRRRRARV